MGLPDVPKAPEAPPPPNLAQNLAANAETTRRRKMQSSLGLSKYFTMLNSGAGGGSTANTSTPANQAPKVLLGQ
jgi:hypothetical protein